MSVVVEKQEKNMSEALLTFEIENKQPVELLTLTDSLISVGREYNRYIGLQQDLTLTNESRLYIKEIRSGSIIYQLYDLLPYALFAMQETNNIIRFAKHLKSAYDYFRGLSQEKPELDRSSLDDFSKIISPVAKDNGSQLNFNGTFNGDVVVTYSINSLESNAAQNVIGREKDSLREPISKFHEQVVFYWYQAKDDLSSQTGDRGIIESIVSNSVKVIFDNEAVKSEMINVEENIFSLAYIVDVKVETINGRPIVYKITKHHEHFAK